jgi:hypothetical protein
LRVPERRVRGKDFMRTRMSSLSVPLGLFRATLQAVPRKGCVMKRLVLLGALGFGLSGLGSGQNNQGQDNNNQGHNVVTMPEGTVVELPLFLGGLGLWFWSRHRSATKLGSQTPDQ